MHKPNSMLDMNMQLLKNTILVFVSTVKMAVNMQLNSGKGSELKNIDYILLTERVIALIILVISIIRLMPKNNFDENVVIHFSILAHSTDVTRKP